MDKEILIQYSSLKEECRDIQEDIKKIESRIKKLEKGQVMVSDTVKGTRSDGTYGFIKITGVPVTYYDKQNALLQKRTDKLKIYELEVLKMVIDVDEYINSLDDSRIRRLLRYKYLNEMSWVQVAHRMGGRYTADSCRKQIERFLQE